jgi:hypothetical protein
MEKLLQHDMTPIDPLLLKEPESHSIRALENVRNKSALVQDESPFVHSGSRNYIQDHFRTNGGINLDGSVRWNTQTHNAEAEALSYSDPVFYYGHISNHQKGDYKGRSAGMKKCDWDQDKEIKKEKDKAELQNSEKIQRQEKEEVAMREREEKLNEKNDFFYYQRGETTNPRIERAFSSGKYQRHSFDESKGKMYHFFEKHITVDKEYAKCLDEQIEAKNNQEDPNEESMPLDEIIREKRQPPTSRRKHMLYNDIKDAMTTEEYRESHRKQNEQYRHDLDEQMMSKQSYIPPETPLRYLPKHVADEMKDHKTIGDILYEMKSKPVHKTVRESEEKKRDELQQERRRLLQDLKKQRKELEIKLLERGTSNNTFPFNKPNIPPNPRLTNFEREFNDSPEIRQMIKIQNEKYTKNLDSQLQNHRLLLKEEEYIDSELDRKSRSAPFTWGLPDKKTPRAPRNMADAQGYHRDLDKQKEDILRKKKMDINGNLALENSVYNFTNLAFKKFDCVKAQSSKDSGS